MLREAKWEATRGEAAVVRGGALTKAARLAIAAATFLIFPVLPLHAQKESVLYSFSGPPADGGSPSGSLVRDNVTGDLYGTTQNGGPSNFGIVFKLHPNGDGSYTETVLYSFDATSGDGQLPVAGLVIDGSGNLYGTTQAGGGSTACQFGCGTVFELVKSSGSYTEKVLHSFTGAPDGQSPGSLSMDTSGNLYGTTEFGGSAKSTSICKAGCGAVFELANNSGSYTYSVLFSFSIAGLYGMNPAGSVVIDSSGNLYGTTPSGGHASACGVALGCGVVYELVNSSGVYAPSVLYNFVGVPDGELPGSNLILDAQGNLYGTASGGVSTACSSFGCGAVFKLHPNGGGSYTESLLYSFTGSPDGQYPGNLEVDASGDFYGITGAGGASTACIGCGTVFKLHSNGDGSYTESVLYSFTGSPDGAVPTGLVLDASDNVYGTTGLGGTSTVCSISGCGSVFEITAGSTGAAGTISAASGSGQTATVNENFSAPLMAAVVNGSGVGVSDVTVTFMAIASAGGASGTFAGGVNTAVTNASGIATSAVFTANGTAGSYAVTATAPNVSGTATFTLTNAAVQTATTITVSTSSSDHGTALPSNDALVGNPVTVSFKVAQTSGSATPTGNVVVSDGVGDTCTPSPVILTSASAGAGSCTLTIASLPASGNATLTATFTPNSNAFSGSTGSATESVVEISACGPSVPEQVVKQGATVTYSFTVCVAGNANAVAPVANVVDCVPRGKCTLGDHSDGPDGRVHRLRHHRHRLWRLQDLVVPQPRIWPELGSADLFCSARYSHC